MGIKALCRSPSLIKPFNFSGSRCYSLYLQNKARMYIDYTYRLSRFQPWRNAWIFWGSGDINEGANTSSLDIKRHQHKRCHTKHSIDTMIQWYIPSMLFSCVFDRGISENQIKQVSKTHLSGNSYTKSQLLSLNLSNNAIEYIQPGAISGLRDLILL